MRIKLGFGSCVLALLGMWSAAQPASAQTLSITDGSISIRALADRQRRFEEAEFRNRLNPDSNVAPQGTLSFQPNADGAVQALPPVGLDLAPAPVQEPEHAPVNTVLSVYGQEGKLTVEVAKKKGAVERYQLNDDWAGHRIVDISREGVKVTRAGKTRVIPVGGKL